ncbi:MAG: Cyclic pyranopterin monophosphate synthase [Promethearchaeota archaeon]|nr:MAG: Cyclic pyranopterin monophosphate synthase [Candidatus Lokiarchaeota archaeon]
MNEIIHVKKDSAMAIPLFGSDFLGIIDRGTNIIELKPLTRCNLKCKYCFVSAGAYDTDFILDSQYLLEQTQKMVDFKDPHDLEIHLAPYGEILLYRELFELLKGLWNVEGIEIISMQTNGVLLNPPIIEKLAACNLTRINISINTLNPQLARSLSACSSYNISKLLEHIELLLHTDIDVLLAPVWFPGENDKDIIDIIQYVLTLREKYQSDTSIELILGIQKYLVYKTGRKLKKIRPKSWGYFYQQLKELEERFHLKLKLGPKDFGIHPRPLLQYPLQEGEIITVQIVSKGRWKNECIGKINENFCSKVLLNHPLEYDEALLGKQVKVKVISSNQFNNLITSYLPF